MLIYISGLISTNSNEKQIEANKALFFEMEEILISKGHEVINPARNVCNTWEEYMALSFEQQKVSDCTYFLRNYAQSTGARIEELNARRLNHVMEYQEEYTLDYWLNYVSEKEEITVKQIKSKSRTRAIVDARYFYYCEAYKNTNRSLTKIGDLIGKSHAQVIHGMREVKEVKELKEKYKRYC